MKYVIGIDGGGTKTKGYLGNSNGEIVGVAFGGPSNYHSVGMDRVKTSLSDVIRTLRGNAGIEKNDIDLISLGIAGVNRSEDREVMQHILCDIGFDNKCILNNDAKTALVGAHGKEEGIVTVCGTGSICLGLDCEGTYVRTGGWGHIIGDEGSGYDIGINGLKAIMMSYDRRSEKTILTQKVLDYLNISSPEGLVKYVYQDSCKEDIARLAVQVSEAANEGDRVAINILKHSAVDLAKLTEAVIKQLKFNNNTIPLCLTGGIFQNIDLIKEEFTTIIEQKFEQIDMHIPLFDAAMGAVLIAWNQLNIYYDIQKLKH